MNYQECWYYKALEGGGNCMLTEKPSRRVHPCPCEHGGECYSPEEEK